MHMAQEVEVSTERARLNRKQATQEKKVKETMRVQCMEQQWPKSYTANEEEMGQ